MSPGRTAPLLTTLGVLTLPLILFLLISVTVVALDLISNLWSTISPPLKAHKHYGVCRSQFINLIREHSCLWQERNTNYKNKTVKSVSLNTLTKRLTSTINCVVTPDMIMKKLHTLRGQYRREVKEMKTSQKSGAGTDNLYLPRLWCYDALAFLGDGDTHRDSTSTLDELQVSQ